jgi:MFS family permease
VCPFLFRISRRQADHLDAGIALVAYIYSLDGASPASHTLHVLSVVSCAGTTTYQYLAYATSSFGDHSALATIQVAQAIILAVAKPPAAKIADLFGRAEAYAFFVLLYTLGYIGTLPSI